MAKKTFSRLLATVLAVIMLAALIPASAAEATWTTVSGAPAEGTLADHPYIYFNESSNWAVNSGRAKTTDGYYASAVFSFNGTGVRVYAYLNNQDSKNAQGNSYASGEAKDGVVDAWHNNNNVWISIDNGEPQKMTLQSDVHTVKTDYMCYELTGLPEGGHSAVIFTQPAQAPSASGSFDLHSVSVLGSFIPKVSIERPVVDGALNSKINWEAGFSVASDGQRAYSTSGGKCSFQFTGTGLLLNATINNQDGSDADNIVDAWHNNNNVYISIDGGEPQLMRLMTTWRTVKNDCPVYFVSGLDNAVHTAVITVKSSVAPVNNGSFNIYSIGVENGSLVKYDWTSVNAYTGTSAGGDLALNTKQFTFNGAWGAEKIVNGDTAVTHQAIGNSISFDFEGEALSLTAFVNCQDQDEDGVAEKLFSNDNVTISIDGGAPVKLNIDRKEHTVAYTDVYTSPALKKGIHTAVITAGERIRQDAGYDFCLQSVSVANGSVIEWNKVNAYTGTKAAGDIALNTDYFEFKGNWLADNIVNGDTAVTHEAVGHTVSFGFTGTALKVTAFVNCQDGDDEDTIPENIYSNDNVYISIDGGEPVALTMVRDAHTVAYTTVFESGVLEEGDHTAVITAGERISPNAGYDFCFQSVSVANGSVTARPKSEITVTVGEGGTADKATSNVLNGEEFTVNFTPNEGYLIDDVKINGESVGAIASYSIEEVTEAVAIEVSFRKQTFEIAVLAGEHGSALQETTAVEYGEDFTVTFVPEENYEIEDVLVDGESVGAVESYTFEDVTEAHTIVASFKLSAVEVKVTVGEGGTANAETQMVIIGEIFAVDFEANEGYLIADVLIDGVSVGAVDAVQFTVEKACEVEVVFEAIPDKTGWAEIGGFWYYVKDGELVTNAWKKDSKGWVFLGEDGKMVTNTWKKDSKDWCYLGEDGYMVKSAWIEDSKGWCYVGKDGYILRNSWKKDSTGWVYLGKDGRMVINKWVKDSKGWCYVGEDGYMVADDVVEDSKGWCYLDKTGHLVFDKWIYVEWAECWIHTDDDGRLITDKWMKDSKGWVYLDNSGIMVTNAWVMDSAGWCYVGEDGYCLTGTQVIDGVEYTFKSNGQLIGPEPPIQDEPIL